MAKKSSTRVETFDLMRGYFLIAIAINHLNYVSPLSYLTMRGELFVSSAEGFFFLSGLVLGIVRGAKLITASLRKPAKLLLLRAVQLFAVYIISTVVFTLIGWWFFMDNPGLKPGIASPDMSPLTMIWQALTFQYLYGWMDYLRLYIFFIALSPIAILLLRNQLWWLLLTISWMIWYLAPALEWPANVYLQPYHWQLIFFGGMIVGFYWQQLAAWWRSLPRVAQTTIITTVVGATGITLAFSIYLAFGGKISYEVYQTVAPMRDMLSPYFDKENMPFWRLVIFTLWFWAAFWLFSVLEKPLKKFFGWILLPLGTNSLYVYIMSGVLIFFVHLFVPRMSFWINTLVIGGILALTLLMVRTKFLMKIIPR